MGRGAEEAVVVRSLLSDCATATPRILHLQLKNHANFLAAKEGRAAQVSSAEVRVMVVMEAG